MSDDYVKRSDVHKVFQPKYAPAINRTFAAMIDSVPAADVVEVVRCKDCVHRDPEDHKCDCGGQERQGCPLPVRGSYFCAHGKRKDGGQDDV